MKLDKTSMRENLTKARPCKRAILDLNNFDRKIRIKNDWQNKKDIWRQMFDCPTFVLGGEGRVSKKRKCCI